MKLQDQPAPADTTAGYKPDPLNPKKLREWDGQKWTSHTALPPGTKNPVPNWAIAIGVVVGLIVLVVALADSGGDSDPVSAKPEPPKMVAAKVTGTCPGQMFVGLPVTLRFRMTNPGTVDYPATYMGMWDGSGPFVRNGAAAGGIVGDEGDGYGFQGGWQFGPLGAGKSQRMAVTLTPKDVGNFDALEVGFWGNRQDEDITPYGRARIITCDDITINPGL